MCNCFCRCLGDVGDFANLTLLTFPFKIVRLALKGSGGLLQVYVKLQTLNFTK